MTRGSRWLAAPLAGGSRSGSLRRRFALWTLLSTTISLLVFGVAVFAVFLIHEQAEAEDRSLEDISWEAASAVLPALAIALPVGLMVAASGALWLARRALAPIDAVVQAARQMTARDLQRRLPIPDADDELRALVVAQNALFARLEQGFDALSRFAADASHELRTPLAVLGNELEIALHRPRSVAEWEAAGQRMRVELARTHRLVEALLAIAHADDAPIERAVVACDANLVLADIVMRHASLGASRGILVTTEPTDSGQSFMVQADTETVAIVLANLVANALRYTPPGGTIRAGSERRGGTVVTHVDDTGAGVAPEEAEAIFGAFSRGREGRAADARDSEGPRGLGLGLSLVRRIVDRHGGSVLVERSPYGGARFIVEWPALVERDDGRSEG